MAVDEGTDVILLLVTSVVVEVVVAVCCDAEDCDVVSTTGKALLPSLQNA